jgi:prepilin-type N-terminal cleavage/methylation domain-containing protein
MKAGFTLIEVVLATAILAMVAVAVMPLWSDVQRAPRELPVRAAAWDALRQVSSLQLAAVAEGASLVVESGSGPMAIRVVAIPAETMPGATGIAVRLVWLEVRQGNDPRVLARAVRMLSPPPEEQRP